MSNISKSIFILDNFINSFVGDIMGNWLFDFEHKNRLKNIDKSYLMKYEEKVINKRILGFIVAFLVMVVLSLVLFSIDEVGLCVICAFVALLQIIFIIITPIFYVFSEERLVIKYFFGLEENIPWQNVRAITSHLEEAGRFIYLDSYKFYYYSEEKHLFYMYGVVAKNKSTINLMKKYCPKNLKR